MWLDRTCNGIEIALKCPVQQYGNVGVLLPPIERGWESILRRIGIPRRAVYGVWSRHAVRPNEVKDLPRSGRPRMGMCQQWLQTGLRWHYGGLTAQKYADHILRPHRISRTLMIMHWQIELSSRQDKRWVSCQKWRLMSSYGQQRAPISILLRAYGRIYPYASMEWIHYLEIPLGFVQQHTMNDRASHKRASDGLVTSVARRFVPSCRLQIDMSIINN